MTQNTEPTEQISAEVLTGPQPEEDALTEGEAAAGAPPAPLASSKELVLPQDPEAPEFSEALQALKPLYESRTVYNFMVCDQLALRGIPPNGMNVRNAGRWGNPNAAGSDVRAWYAGLASRLTVEHANIPEAVKRGANGLLEQMWSLLRTAVEEPAREQLQGLEAMLRACNAELATEQSESAKLREQIVEAKTTHERITADLRGQLSLAEDDMARFRETIVKLQASIAEAALQHERDRRDELSRHQVALEELRREHQAALQAHAGQVASLNDALARERDRIDAAAKAHALAIDGFRQDVREANRRADSAAAMATQEKARADAKSDELSKAELRAAHADMQASEARKEAGRFQDELNRCSESQALTKSEVTELRVGLEAAQGMLAAANTTIEQLRSGR